MYLVKARDHHHVKCMQMELRDWSRRAVLGAVRSSVYLGYPGQGPLKSKN